MPAPWYYSISIIYLLMQLASLFSNTSRPYDIQNGALVINKNEFLSDIKTYSVILAGIVAGWCLLTGKRLGWMLGLPILSFMTAIVGSIAVQQALKLKKIRQLIYWLWRGYIPVGIGHHFFTVTICPAIQG